MSKKVETKKQQKLFQGHIIQKFMNDAQWNEFMREYHSKANRSHNRADVLSAKINPDDVALLKTYLEDTDTPVKEMAESMHVHSTSVVNKVGRTALRLLYQNDNILSKIG